MKETLWCGYSSEASWAPFSQLKGRVVFVTHYLIKIQFEIFFSKIYICPLYQAFFSFLFFFFHIFTMHVVEMVNNDGV